MTASAAGTPFSRGTGSARILGLADDAPLPKGAITSNTVGRGPVMIGKTMDRVEVAVSVFPGAKRLNDMPDFEGADFSGDDLTSQMMQHNRKWMLEQMQSGRQRVDIGIDPTR